MKGFIKISRNTINVVNNKYSKTEYPTSPISEKEALLYLYEKAWFGSRTGLYKGIVLGKGDYICSLAQLGLEFGGWKKTKVRTFLHYLQDNNIVKLRIERKHHIINVVEIAKSIIIGGEMSEVEVGETKKIQVYSSNQTEHYPANVTPSHQQQVNSIKNSLGYGYEILDTSKITWDEAKKTPTIYFYKKWLETFPLYVQRPKEEELKACKAIYTQILIQAKNMRKKQKSLMPIKDEVVAIDLIDKLIANMKRFNTFYAGRELKLVASKYNDVCRNVINAKTKDKKEKERCSSFSSRIKTGRKRNKGMQQQILIPEE